MTRLFELFLTLEGLTGVECKSENRVLSKRQNGNQKTVSVKFLS